EIIQRCIQSTKAQTYQNFEQIICSDGPEENVKKFIESLKNPKIKYINLEKHQGDYANTARQEALEIAKGKYIVFLDDDNIIFPHYLEKMLKPLEKSNKEI